ncbi:late embryogenesis abundant protein 31-like [Lolium rigidum]|uniref:late embryogenesis abundant protein 31-like n=1 Tax=Lolium rigidum TaxID=89674 RepID=UPI001F5C3476|nr:late embryogenesis abundant protein 31-like [Lolium rigidum]
MAQAQATRGDQHLKAAQQEQPEAIQYGHVFAVTGDLAVQAIAPRDAEAMRSAEDSVPGVPVPQASGGGFSAAVAMETAAAYNQAVGAVHPGQASAAATMKGITVTQTAVPGGRVVTEFVAGQVVGQYSVADQAMMEQAQRQQQVVEEDTSKVTIGEAMEAAALSAGERPVEEADAAAIRAAETQAQGEDGVLPGGLADQAWAAASANAWAERDEDKITIGDVLTDATTKLADDKPAEHADAARVVQAETYSDAGARTKAGGVGAAMTTAARLNQEDDDDDA